MIPVKLESYTIREEKWSAIREILPELPEKFEQWYHETLWLDRETLVRLAPLGVELRVVKEELNGSYVKLADQLESLKLRCDDLAGQVAAGAGTVIAVPDIGLMTIREVQVLEDCCTDHLQRQLDEGWRLLAVCPPNAQRRPDYVLGRCVR